MRYPSVLMGRGIFAFFPWSGWKQPPPTRLFAPNISMIHIVMGLHSPRDRSNVLSVSRAQGPLHTERHHND